MQQSPEPDNTTDLWDRDVSRIIVYTETSDRTEVSHVLLCTQLPRILSDKQRRKAQNRASQRAFRKRKENSLKSLEVLASELQSEVHGLREENQRLVRQIEELSLIASPQYRVHDPHLDELFKDTFSAYSLEPSSLTWTDADWPGDTVHDALN